MCKVYYDPAACFVVPITNSMLERESSQDAIEEKAGRGTKDRRCGSIDLCWDDN